MILWALQAHFQVSEPLDKGTAQSHYTELLLRPSHSSLLREGRPASLQGSQILDNGC